MARMVSCGRPCSWLQTVREYWVRLLCGSSASAPPVNTHNRTAPAMTRAVIPVDRKSTRLNSSHSLHDVLPISPDGARILGQTLMRIKRQRAAREHAQQNRSGHDSCCHPCRSEEHTSELQSLPTRRSSDLSRRCANTGSDSYADQAPARRP